MSVLNSQKSIDLTLPAVADLVIVEHKLNRYASCQSVVKVRSLHQKNLHKIRKAYKKNSDIIRESQDLKVHYQSFTIPRDDRRIENIFKQTQQKVKVMKKVHDAQLAQAVKNKERYTHSIFTQSMKLRKKQIQKMQAADKRRTELSASHAWKKIPNHLSYKQLRKKEQQSATALMLEAAQKRIKEARDRRSRNSSIISEKSVDLLNEKINYARNYVEKRNSEREHYTLQLSARKRAEYQDRLVQRETNRRKEVEGKRKLTGKKLYDANKKKSHQENALSSKYQRQLEQTTMKLEKSLLSKQSRIHNYRNQLADRTKQLKKEAANKLRRIKLAQLQRAEEICSKQNQDWNFLTNLRSYQKNAIQKNIYENNKVSLFR